MIEHSVASLKEKVRHRVWLMSDLQQHDPAKSEAGLRTAVEDYRRLALPCEAIWYLGDATEGHALEALNKMADIHLEYLRPLGIPLRYLLGNHDFDLYKARLQNGAPVDPPRDLPFWRSVQSVPGWRTTDELEQWYYTEEVGEYLVVFFSDHGSSSGKWWTTHGDLHGDAAAYPYGDADFDALRERIASSGKRVITVGHYALAGGARASTLLNRMLPLPANVKLHIHGHSHIGDRQWGGAHLHRKIAGVDHHAIPQVNISSLENIRGSAVRSAFLDIYEDGSLGVWFRNHQDARWENALMTAP